MKRGASIIEVHQSFSIKVVLLRCVDTSLGSVMSYQEICTMFNIPREGTEVSLREISSISAVISIVSSAIRISGWTNQERLTSLIAVASDRLIQCDISIEVVLRDPSIL